LRDEQAKRKVAEDKLFNVMKQAQQTAAPSDEED